MYIVYLLHGTHIFTSHQNCSSVYLGKVQFTLECSWPWWSLTWRRGWWSSPIHYPENVSISMSKKCCTIEEIYIQGACCVPQWNLANNIEIKHSQTDTQPPDGLQLEELVLFNVYRHGHIWPLSIFKLIKLLSKKRLTLK